MGKAATVSVLALAVAWAMPALSDVVVENDAFKLVVGEWKGTSVRTKTLLGAGISVLAVGFCTMAAGGK